MRGSTVRDRLRFLRLQGRRAGGPPYWSRARGPDLLRSRLSVTSFAAELSERY